MDEIVELARRLGKAISESPQAKSLHAAQEELDSHGQIAQVLKDYNAQADKIAQLERDNKPVEVDDKRKLQQLHESLIASDTFKKYTAAQVEYVDLMRRVNDALQQQLAKTEDIRH